MAGWTFLTNHARVLLFLAKHPSITALDLSNSIGITERATRKIIADLVADGYISVRKVGRRNKYRLDPDQPLRHDVHQEFPVGDLLQVLGWKRRRKRSAITDTQDTAINPQ